LCLLVLAVVCFFALSWLKELIETAAFDHNPYHVDVAYYESASAPTSFYHHRMDELVLYYARHPRFGWLNDRPFLARWTGSLRIPEAGKYTFEVSGEEHTVLYLNDVSLVDNQKALAIGKKRMGTSTNLAAGRYTFRLDHEHQHGDAWFKVKWRRGKAKTEVLRAPDITSR